MVNGDMKKGRGTCDNERRERMGMGKPESMVLR